MWSQKKKNQQFADETWSGAPGSAASTATTIDAKVRDRRATGTDRKVH